MIPQLLLTEAAAGDPKAAQDRLAVLADLPLLENSPEITRLAERFLRPDCLPVGAKDDAMQLAFCAVHGVPYLWTWNFRHLANPDNRRQLLFLWENAGYELPLICTPDEMMKGEL